MARIADFEMSKMRSSRKLQRCVLMIPFRTYILDEKGRPVLERDQEKWQRWFAAADRRVGDDMVGEVRISTVFFGVDTSIGDGPPVLWETIVFGGILDSRGAKCSGSREQAEAMHVEWVARVRATIPNPN